MLRSSGSASLYEMGSTGIFVMTSASLRSMRFASFVAPMPGVRGSPGWTGISITEPRCAPLSLRYGPFG